MNAQFPAYRMRKLEVVEHPISSLTPYANNARTHTERQVRQIAASIRRVGFTNPILIDETNMVIAGHARLAAATHLAMPTVPTVKLDGLTEKERRAYILADNRLAEAGAGWDEKLLARELEFLLEGEFEFDLDFTGFDSADIDRLLHLDGIEPENEVVPLPSPDQPVVSRVGDLWIIGRHRLLCGDARSSENYDRLLDGERAEMVFSDPPYNVAIDGHVSGLGAVQHRDFAMASGEMTPTEFTAFLRQVFRRLVAVSADGAIHFLCMDWRHIREITDAADGVYRELKNLCVWSKQNAGMGSFYRSQHELVFAYKAGPGPHINNFALGQKGRHRSNVWNYAGVNSFRAGREADLAMHPTVKPTAMVADAILDCSHPGGLVLDAFAGSGSTLLAAERTGRRGAAIEIDPAYVDLCLRRLEQASGETARLDSGGSFAEVAAARLGAGVA